MEKKLAIRVKNEHEFNLLMSKYKRKGWTDVNNYHPNSKGYMYPTKVMFCDKWWFEVDSYEPSLDFSTFAQIAGIEVMEEKTIKLGRTTVVIDDTLIKFSQPVTNLFHSDIEQIYSACKEVTV